jgi:hypothetical protein
LVAFVDGPVAVNLSHISPVVLWKGLKPPLKHGKGGGASSECEEKPLQEPSGHFILPPGVGGGIDVSDDRKVRGGIPVGVAGHPSSIHALNPLSWSLHSIMTGEVDMNLSLVFNVSTQQVNERLLHDGQMGCH